MYNYLERSKEGVQEFTMCTGKLEEVRGPGRLEEVRGKLGGGSKEFMFLDHSVSARCAFYILVCPATPIAVQPICFSAPVSQTPKYDSICSILRSRVRRPRNKAAGQVFGRWTKVSTKDAPALFESIKEYELSRAPELP